jgi:hypothetical protein
MLTSKAFSDIVTFSRSSNATRIGPTGRVEYAPHNLLPRSEEFDNAYWSKDQSSVVANSVAAPNATITADKIVEDTALQTHGLYRLSLSVTSGLSYTWSIYAKKAERTWLILSAGGGANNSAWFNLTTGATGTVQSGVTNATITSVGNDWYRCSVTRTVSSASANFECYASTADNTTSYTGDGTSGIYLWGAQLSVGPYPLDYTPTTTAAVYGPRFDYDPVTLAARGLLVEEQRTNLLVRSEEFDNAAWTKSLATVTSNSTESPSGTITADTITFTGAFGDAFNFTAVNPASSAYTGSVWLKGSGSLIIRISNNVDQQFTTTVNLTSTFTRYTVSGTFNSTPGTLFFAISRNDLTATSVVVWGAQLEAGSFATSYIPTIASTVTRSADVASVNTLSPWYNSECTIYSEASVLPGNVNNSTKMLFGGGSTNESPALLEYYGTIQSLVQGVGFPANSGVALGNVPKKIATRIKNIDHAISVNGALVTSASAMAAGVGSTFFIGSSSPGTTDYLNGHIKQIKFFPRGLSNAELQTLTA